MGIVVDIFLFKNLELIRTDAIHCGRQAKDKPGLASEDMRQTYLARRGAGYPIPNPDKRGLIGMNAADWSNLQARLAAAISAGSSGGLEYLGDDGKWQTFNGTRLLPNGIYRAIE